MCRVHRVDKDFQCITQNPMFGDPKLGTEDECSEYTSEAGTDKDEYGQ